MFLIILLLESKLEVNAIGKSTKQFLNLKKQSAVNGIVKKIIKNDIEVTDLLKIQHESRMFYEQLFKKTIYNANSKIVSFSDNIFFPVLNIDLTEPLIFLKSMQNNKTPENDGLTTDFKLSGMK